MTETRRSFIDPVPPPHPAGATYDANQLLVRRVLCRGCSREFCAPVRVDPETYLCPECTR